MELIPVPRSVGNLMEVVLIQRSLEILEVVVALVLRLVENWCPSGKLKSARKLR